MESQSSALVWSAGSEFVARLLAKWDESQPRDERGQFAGGSGSLSPTEQVHVEMYTGDTFFDVNRQLRSGDASDPSVRHLDSALAKSPIPAGTVLYRGMPRDAAKAMFGGTINKGDTVSDKAFVSTSRDPDRVPHRLGGVVMEITVGKGAKGLDVAGVSRNPQEKEVLLPRGARFTVTGISAPKKPGDPVIVRCTHG